ncbi:MAG: hypothetical protein AAF517_08385 [Planctomycetota bacterium]
MREGSKELHKGAAQIEVVAEQFRWIVRYPGPDGVFGRVRLDQIDQTLNPLGLDASDPAAADDIVVLDGQLRLPAGWCRLNFRAHDVLHALAIPALGVRLASAPGRPVGMDVEVPTTLRGEFLCTELCGLGHYRMRGAAFALEKSEWSEWLEGAGR